MLSLLLAAVAAATPADAAAPILEELTLFEDAPGTYVEYEVSGTDQTSKPVIRLTLMAHAPDSGAPRRWIRMTVALGPEQFEAWALARKGPNGVPRREKLVVAFRDKVVELPPEEDPGATPEPTRPKVEVKGTKTLKVPAGEFKATELHGKTAELDLTVWVSPKVPMGGKRGGVVKMQSPAGGTWELVSYGKTAVRAPPAATP